MKCDVIAAGVVAAAKQVGLKVPLVVRLEGTNVDLGKKILADSGLPIISGSEHGRRGAESRRRRKGKQMMSILINKNTRVITQGITGKTGQFHTQMGLRVREREELLRRRREPEEARREVRGHPDLRDGEGSEGRDRRQRLGDLRAAAVRGRRDRRGGRSRPRPRDLHHRGHPGARHGRAPRRR